MIPPPLSAVGIHPNDEESASSATEDFSASSSPSSSSQFCPPFQSDEALDAYLATIAPPRELICPITQELLKDPVVAEDGHTYERNSLTTWFTTMGRTRSPVTNSLLEDTSAENLVTNLAVASMAVAHRERLGRELIDICRGVRDRGGRACDEDGVGARMEGLLDAGADPNGRCGDGANTPLHLVIQSGNIHLATHLLNHEANVTFTNDAGMDCIATAERVFSEQQQQRNNNGRQERHTNAAAVVTISEWNEFIQELKRREASEKARMEARDRARSQANDE